MFALALEVSGMSLGRLLVTARSTCRNAAGKLRCGFRFCLGLCFVFDYRFGVGFGFGLVCVSVCVGDSFSFGGSISSGWGLITYVVYIKN